MGEFIPTRDGIPLKTTDAMLDEISRLHLVIAALLDELNMYRSIVPKGSDRPTNV